MLVHGDRAITVSPRPAARTASRETPSSAAGLLERAMAERLLQPLADRLEVDPQRRERIAVDPRRPQSGQERAVRDVSVCDTELVKDSARASFRVAGEGEQQVLGADVSVAEPPRLISASDEVPLGRPDRRDTRPKSSAEQPHRDLLPGLEAEPTPAFVPCADGTPLCRHRRRHRPT